MRFGGLYQKSGKDGKWLNHSFLLHLMVNGIPYKRVDISIKCQCYDPSFYNQTPGRLVYPLIHAQALSPRSSLSKFQPDIL